ncbi:MAG: response regulator transcription factor [Anaerolineae bacterium]|nr:response regulator transcription factor [Anaerolineae bacterium]
MARILVVEDTLDLAQLIARELRASNFEVTLADNGRQALELHAAQRPDLIILDWNLPELDGLEVLRRLRQYASTPVLMLTGRVDEIDRVVGLEVGADDYLVKPFSMRELLARTRAMLRRVELIRQQLTLDHSKPSELLTYQGMCLDLATHTVTLNGLALDLSRIEFDLLHLFLAQPGRVFSRDALLDQVWGNAYDGQDRSVDYVIHRLRQKITPLSDCIETVRGVGYRLRS